MIASEQFVVEWDRLFRFTVGQVVEHPDIGLLDVLEQGMRRANGGGFRKQYRFLMADGRFEWFDEERLRDVRPTP